MAAQDAELKLKVSLDLAFFRQQLAGLGQAAAGYNMPINVRFDRRSVQNELNALGANIRRRNYRLNIETNLSAEIAKAGTLARKLDELGKKIKNSAGSAFSSGPQGAAGLEKFMREQGLTGRAFGVRQAQENIARQAILARLEKKSLSAGGYNVKGLEKIIRDLGGTPTGGRTDLVAQAKKLVQESDGIADAVFEGLKDLQMKLKPIRGQAQMSAARSMPNLNQMLDRIANLTENPRAAQRMLRMMPESRLTTDLIGAANRQAAFREQFPQGFRLPGFGGAKAFDPLLKTIAKDFSDYAKTVNISDPWVGKIGDGIRRVIAVSAQAAATTKALPPVGGTSSPLNALERQLASSRGALGTGGGVAGAMFTGRGLVNPGVSMLSPVGISGNYRQMAAALANQAANPALAHRQIADIGFGAVPASTTGLSGQALNTALNQAYFQRRGLGVTGAQSIPIFSTQGVAVQQNIPGMAYRMGGGGMGGSMGMFPMSGMMGPSSPLTINARSSMFAGGGGAVPPGGGGGGRGGFGGMGGFGGFGRAMGGINLPGVGTIRELGSEFAFATKQVLLFGQAYKMLSFLQGFPGQVGQAVAELQSFKNTLSAISPTAEEARLSNELILGLVERYNIPLESARQGFVKLYASMEPAGFSGKEISDLFTGVSKASATLGLSADKVDRVTYAFAQMASKGQIMSEEVTGQLGDTIPGALSIMAEAAGMGLAEFKKAMEDGEFIGKRFTEVMNNVPKVLEDRFGKGAEGAAKTFQGALNNMQTSLKLFYESFEPAAVAFLNTFVTPIASQLRQLADGFNAFFTGSEAKTFGGEKLAAELNALRPAFEGIIANAKEFVPLLQTLGDIGLGVAKAFTVLAGNPVAGFLAKTYAQALLLTTAFKVLAANAIVQTIRSLIQMVAQLTIARQTMLSARQTMLSTQVQMALLTSNAGALSAAFRSGALGVAGLGAAIKTALLSGVVTAAIVLIDQLIGRIQQLKAEAASVQARGKGAKQEVKAAYAGGVDAGRGAAAGKEAEARSASRLSGIYRDLASGKTISASDYEFAKEQGASISGLIKDKNGYTPIGQASILGGVGSKTPVFKREYERYSLQQAQTAENIRQGVAAGQREGETAAAAQAARDARNAKALANQSAQAGAAKGKGEKERESQVPVLQLELATTEKLFEIEKQTMEARLAGNELEVVRLNGLKEQLRIEEQIAKVKLDTELPAAEKALQIQQLMKQAEMARLQTNFELEEKIAEAHQRVQDAVTQIGKQAEAELSDKREYERLVSEGVLPSEAKITVEVNRQFAVELEKLKLLEEQIKDQIALLEAKENTTKEDQAQLDILREHLKLTRTSIGDLPQVAGKVRQTRIEGEKPQDAGVSLREEAEELRKELDKLLSVQEMVKFSAASIGEAFSTSFKDAITGAATAQEALAGFFQSVGNAFADMAAQMIRKMIQMYVLNQFLNILPGGGMFKGNASIQGGGFGSFSGGAFGIDSAGALGQVGQSLSITPFANGGVVTGPTMGLVGEGRYNEAVVPLPDGKTIPVDLGNAAGNQIVSNITVNVSNGQAQSNANGSNSSELGRKLEGAVKQVIVGELRPGGLLAR
jgi:tape measure domain-containing protein